jgi:hypothetical protein
MLRADQPAGGGRASSLLHGVGASTLPVWNTLDTVEGTG